MKQVYLIIGFYPDHSGCKVFGAFAAPHEANERADMMKAAECAYSITVMQLQVGVCDPKEVW